jgi:hypothetical protein
MRINQLVLEDWKHSVPTKVSTVPPRGSQNPGCQRTGSDSHVSAPSPGIWGGPLAQGRCRPRRPANRRILEKRQKSLVVDNPFN